MKLSNLVVSGKWEGVSARVDEALRDIRAILNGGFRFSDQCVTRTFRWNTADAPVRVSVPSGKPPLGLVVLRAVFPPPAAATRVAGGGTIGWSWDGSACAIEEITGLFPGLAYDVTVLVVEG